MQTAAPTWSSIDVTTAKWYARLMPCLRDLAFLLPACLLFFKLAGTRTLFTDGDTGWHIRTGEWILQHRAVPREDLFSFTKPHQPWFAWEWGWDLLFALIHRAGGLAAVGFVSVLLLGLCAVLLYKLVVHACGNDVLAFFVTAFAACGCMIHFLARPHLFSWLFFLAFLHLIARAEDGNPNVLWWCPCLTLLWVNIHGAFFVGFALLLLVAAGKFAESLIGQGQIGQEKTWRSAATSCRPFVLSAAGCFAATFVNPYTWHLHRHVIAYLTDAKLLDNIQEYQSISFHCGPALPFEIMLLLGGAAAFWHLQSGALACVLPVLLWAHLALLSARNIPFFLMIAAPFVARMLQHALEKWRSLPRIGGGFSTMLEICDEFKTLERLPRVHLLSGLAVLLLAGLFAAGADGFQGQFNPDAFPIQAMPLVEASAARRIFTYDQWGDYLIYRLYPARRVFMDGRSDFYGSEFVTVSQNILGAHYDWKQQLDRFAVDMVLVKPDAPLAAVLKVSSEWRLLFDDGKVLIFQAGSRRGGTSMAGSGPAQRAVLNSDLRKEKLL